MKSHRVYFTFWIAVNTLAVLAFLGLIYGIAWDLQTVNYLHGFSDAIIPASATPAQKVEAILAWMAHGPARRSDAEEESVSLRDPEDTLNYQELLNVCGTATNAFVNVASSSGLQARRLLLLDQNRRAKHVVAEVQLEGQWVVVDPLYRILYRDEQARFVNKDELRDPKVFRQVTRAISNYPPEYTYESTAIVRLRAIPVIGSQLRRIFDRIYPKWEVAFDWTLLLERRSFAFAVAMAFLLTTLLIFRTFLRRYGRAQLGICRKPLGERLRRLGASSIASELS